MFLFIFSSENIKWHPQLGEWLLLRGDSFRLLMFHGNKEASWVWAATGHSVTLYTNIRVQTEHLYLCISSLVIVLLIGSQLTTVFSTEWARVCFSLCTTTKPTVRINIGLLRICTRRPPTLRMKLWKWKPMAWLICHGLLETIYITFNNWLWASRPLARHKDKEKLSFTCTYEGVSKSFEPQAFSPFR